MNYFTLLVLEYQDDTDTKKSLYTYDNLDEAVSRFHSSLGGYIGADNIKTALAVVIDGKGAVKKSEYWETSTTTTTTTTTTDDTTEDTTTDTTDTTE